MAASRLTVLVLAFSALGAGISHLVMVAEVPVAFAVPIGVLSIVEVCLSVVLFSTERMPAPHVIATAAFAPLLLWCLLVVIATLAGDQGIASPLATVPMAIGTAFELATVLVLHFSSRIVSRHA
ncbi:hypothetical protein BH09ACT1_BH09ACT1_01160 [soil metagenome]